MAVRLRYLAHDLEVPMGQFLIGRTSDCQLSLDDPLVSRKHAILIVQPDGVFVEDLGSRNGVFLNGTKIEGRMRVSEGDTVRIGTQDLVLSGVGEVPSKPSGSARNPLTATMQDIRVKHLIPSVTSDDDDNDPPTGVVSTRVPAVEPDKRVHGLSLIGGVADKALALGRADEAERILQRSLAETLVKAQKKDLSLEVAEKAAFYAVRIAAGTGKGTWVDYVFELYGTLRALMPGRLVDELYAVMRKVKHVDRGMLRAYLTTLREIAHGFGPAERFVLQRIEGFERWGPLSTPTSHSEEIRLMPYRLRYLAHDLELPIGDFVIGRSTDCQLSLDDPLVSRRHATIRVRVNGVSVQDLGSRNGVLVNGTKIDGEREITSGDKVSIGSQEMLLQGADEPHPLATAANEEVYRRATQTLGAAYVVDLRAAVAEISSPGPGSQPSSDRALDPPTVEGSRSLQSFQLLGGVADKALALGRAEEAERILQALMIDVLARARDGATVEPSIAESAAKYAARLAGATTRGTWVDYVFDLYRCLKRPLPAQIVDELYTVVRKVKSMDLQLLRAYLADLRGMASSLGPTQKFLIQRLEGLERLVALK